MEDEKLKRRKAMLSNSIIPYFIGISDDLMFFIAINTLFFTVVKGLSATEISFLTTISSLSYIALQIPALKIITKIGNIKSIRIGTIMLLTSSILMTFGNHYWIIMIGHIIYTTSFLFKKMDNVILKNNLNYLKKETDYIRIANKSKIIYAIITAIIALIAGSIFAINHYMPMLLCIGICIISVLLSFCIFDSSEKEEKVHTIQKKGKIKISRILFIIFISFALLYTTISLGQTNSKLFIQYHLQAHFDVSTTAIYFSFILVSSRIARILGNVIFGKLYNKMKDKVNLLLPVIAMIAFACVLIGSILNSMIIIKMILMTIGFDLILAIRDSSEVYITDLLLKNMVKEEQQKGISYLQLSRRIGETLVSLLFSILLIKLDLFFVLICLVIFAMISFIVNIKLYKMIKERQGVKNEF